MRLTVKIIPGSIKCSVEEKEGKLIVRVKSPPEKGKANKELIELLEKYFGKKVSIISGHKSRTKIIEISD